LNSKATICIYAPMKNEEGNISEWCESARQIADQIVILDTGSTDGTIEAAQKEEGVEVYFSKHFNRETKRGEFKFDVARNEALDYSKCDWNIAVDADERLVINDPNLKKNLADVPASISLFFCSVQMLDDAGRVSTDFQGERIFRNLSDVRYKGEMHNYVNVPHNQRSSCNWITVTSCRNKRTHEARAERHKQRMEMAEANFIPKIKDNPQDTRSIFYLARTYKEDGQIVRAIPWFRRYLKTGGWSSERFQAALEMAGCLMSIFDYDEAFEVMVKHIKENWRRAEGYITLGDICYAKNDHTQAAWWYQIAAGCEPFEERLFLNKSAYTWVPWDKMAMCHYHLKEYERAVVAVQTALRFDDVSEGVRARLEKNLKVFKSNLPVVQEICQAHVSRALSFFAPPLQKKFNFKPYSDPTKPALFYGCYYRQGDVEKIMAHKNLAICAWTGSDGGFLARKPDQYRVLKEARHIRHVATSKFIADDLEKFGLKHVYLPIFLSDENFKAVPLGKKIYVYGDSRNTWLYGFDIIRQVQKELPDFEFLEINSPLSEKDRERDMKEVYGECFVGLRPTRHDGICHTAVEMGLMGRRMIWNGSMPNAIRWKTVEDVIINIKKEAELIGITNVNLASEMKEHISLPRDWLTLDFWEE